MHKKIENIQGLRGVAIFFVVVLHLLAMEQKYGHGERLLSDFLTLGASGVDLFFIISGMVMVTVTRGLFQRPAEIAQFFYNRLSRLYPLYWIFSLPVLAIYVAHPEMVNASQGHQVNILESFLLLPQNLLPLLGVGWALIHVIYFYCVFTLLLFAPERRLTNLLILWILFVAIGGLLYEHLELIKPAATIRLITHPLTSEFIAGCIVARLIQNGMRSHGLMAVAIGIVLLLTGSFLFYSASPGAVPKGWLRVALYGVPWTMIAYGAVALEASSSILFPRFLRFIGDASYSIYLSHVLVISAIGRLWAAVSMPGRMDNILVMIAMTGSALLVGIGTYLIIERQISSFFRQAGIKLFRFAHPTAQAG
jgi:peptidoglycan/LPS O-acetylase OafA/YrhL